MFNKSLGVNFDIRRHTYVRLNEQTKEYIKIETPGVGRPLLGPAKKIRHKN